MSKSVYATAGHTYMAGASKPWFVTQGMIVSAAQGKGFSAVKVASRADFPASQVPPLPPGTPNDWDVLGTGVRAPPSGSVDLPDRVRWVVDVTPLSRPDPNFERAPGTPGTPVSYAPPVYPDVVPAGVDWTVAPSGTLTAVLLAAGLGLVGALVYASWGASTPL